LDYLRSQIQVFRYSNGLIAFRDILIRWLRRPWLARSRTGHTFSTWTGLLTDWPRRNAERQKNVAQLKWTGGSVLYGHSQLKQVFYFSLFWTAVNENESA